MNVYKLIVWFVLIGFTAFAGGLIFLAWNWTVDLIGWWITIKPLGAWLIAWILVTPLLSEDLFY